MVEGFAARGWVRFPADPSLADWAGSARRAGLEAVHDPQFAQWHQCEGTWFVGLDALNNDALGRVDGSAPISGAALAFIRAIYGPLPALHRAQVSVVYPGYPRPRSGESEAAFRYRKNRDAAHVDGILAVGDNRQRQIREPHAWILGIPLNAVAPDAAPLVVWEGSHLVMQRALTDALAPHDPATWSGVDLTEAYQTARREVFDTCRRVALPGQPGEAILLHRLMLHGVAPWAADPGEGRMVAYFRPEMTEQVSAWLQNP